ncbi:MAG TPA: ribosome silencing factor [Candidatus Limnocylindrales bacterium]|nr:ribosome silencing factor [Candidatus Limnocylindrales bacterium]
MSKETREQVALAVKAVESKKGEEVVILEMDRAAGAFTDYFVICTGTNPRQIQAIADEVERLVHQAGGRPNSVEGYNQAEWVLLDYVDFVVHVFSERSRGFYDLERLWKSAKRLQPGDLLKKRAGAAAKKPAKKVVRASGRKAAAKSAKARSGAAKKKARKHS